MMTTLRYYPAHSNAFVRMLRTRIYLLLIALPSSPAVHLLALRLGIAADCYKHRRH
jgi:hypothetical protein